jgi:hypothetical protein
MLWLAGLSTFREYADDVVDPALVNRIDAWVDGTFGTCSEDCPETCEIHGNSEEALQLEFGFNFTAASEQDRSVLLGLLTVRVPVGTCGKNNIDAKIQAYATWRSQTALPLRDALSLVDMRSLAAKSIRILFCVLVLL